MYVYSWTAAVRWPWCFVDVGGVGWGGACSNIHVNFALIRHARLLEVLLNFALIRHARLPEVLLNFALIRHFLPAHMVLNHKERGHSTLHPSVTQYVFMWCWRSSLESPDPQRFLEELEALL